MSDKYRELKDENAELLHRIAELEANLSFVVGSIENREKELRRVIDEQRRFIEQLQRDLNDYAPMEVIRPFPYFKGSDDELERMKLELSKQTGNEYFSYSFAEACQVGFRIAVRWGEGETECIYVYSKVPMEFNGQKIHAPIVYPKPAKDEEEATAIADEIAEHIQALFVISKPDLRSLASIEALPNLTKETFIEVIRRLAPYYYIQSMHADYFNMRKQLYSELVFPELDVSCVDVEGHEAFDLYIKAVDRTFSNMSKVAGVNFSKPQARRRT